MSDSENTSPQPLSIALFAAGSALGFASLIIVVYLLFQCRRLRRPEDVETLAVIPTARDRGEKHRSDVRVASRTYPAPLSSTPVPVLQPPPAARGWR